METYFRGPIRGFFVLPGSVSPVSPARGPFTARVLLSLPLSLEWSTVPMVSTAQTPLRGRRGRRATLEVFSSVVRDCDRSWVAVLRALTVRRRARDVGRVGWVLTSVLVPRVRFGATLRSRGRLSFSPLGKPLSRPLPLPRERHSAALELYLYLNCRVIAFVFEYTEPHPHSS